MEKNEIKDNKFTWGDPVLVKKNAPKCFCPGEFASICGIDKIITQKEADEFFCKINDLIYLVEFEDGNSIEVPEFYLEPYQEEKKKS